MYWSYAPTFGVVPTKYILDTDEKWAKFLAHPPVASKEGSCLRGAQFLEGALSPTQLNVACTWGMLFDVDEWHGNEPIPPEEIAELLGCRCIIWTTYNHLQLVDVPGKGTKPPEPRYAVFVPLAKAVLPHQHRFVWEALAERLDGRAGPSQFNLDRLRYLPRLPTEEARANYFWSSYGSEDERIDPFDEWPEITELDPVLDFTSYKSLSDETLEEPDKTGWLSDAEALEKAKVYFGNLGPGVVPGGRHYELFKIGCKLWWDFWLEYDAVLQVLHEVNQRFSEPKPLIEVYRETDETFSRTRGHCRVAQEHPAGHMRRKPMDLTIADVMQIAKVAKKSNDQKKQELGEILLTLVPNKSGHVQPIGKVKDRLAKTRIAARELGWKFPDHDSKVIAEMFADSLSVSEAQEPGAPTLEEVKAMVEIAQQAARDHRDKKKQVELAHKAELIFRASSGTRRHVYTPDEIQQYADNAGCTVTQWRSRWVVVIGASHYNFVCGDYKAPVGKDNFFNAAEVDLSLAEDIELHVVDKSGKTVPLNRQQIISRYGTVCREAVTDLTAQRSYFDAKTETFYEAPCPLRKDIEPEYIPEVAEWLSTFPDPRVNSWVANFTILDRPMAALYLHGKAGSGKTLFAHGLARLYSLAAGPTDMGAYFDSFNDALLKCPLLFADEHLPPALTSKYGTDHFRVMVQAQSRLLKRKFLASTTLRGSFRLLLAANNDKMLPKSTGFMTNEDTIAITERLIYVPLDGKPAKYLKSIPLKKRQAFIWEDLMAKHALWLRDRREETEDRFLVSGGESRVTHRIEYEGTRGAFLLFLYKAVTGDVFVPTGGEGIVPLFRDGYSNKVHVGVNVNLLERHWEDVVGNSIRQPSVGDLSDVLRSTAITGGGKGRRARFNEKQRRFQIVDSKHIVKWAEVNDFDPESFIDAVQERVVKNLGVFDFNSAEPLTVIEGGKK